MRSERIDLVENYIQHNKTVSIDKLCDKFKVSKNTIRRDIEVLVEKGAIQKVYGGVKIKENKELISFEERNIKNSDRKLLISKIAASYINEGDNVFIDSGTTTCNIVEFLKDKKNITIFTNNLTLIYKAQPYENLNIICLSGLLNRTTNSFTGISSVETLKHYNINKCFMACTGLSIKNGITNSSGNEFEIKQTAIEKSSESFLLADNSKFDKISLMTYSPLYDIDNVITDIAPVDEYIEFFEKHKINLDYNN